MGLWKKPSMGEYGHFLQLHNAANSILCLNLLLLIMNHTTRPESGYDVASCCGQNRLWVKVISMLSDIALSSSGTLDIHSGSGWLTINTVS